LGVTEPPLTFQQNSQLIIHALCSLKDHEAELAEACKRDLGKPYFEAQLADIAWVENDIIFVSDNLEKWVKDEKAPDIPLMNALLKPRIRKDPLGCVLVIGFVHISRPEEWRQTRTLMWTRAFNFPVQLSIGPMIGAIAGGNTVVLKPSEGAPASAAVMEKIVKTCLDPDCYTVVQGGVPETQALLEQKWDKIFFTGSDKVGRIIAKAAAPTLTPVTLELGGRNPAIVTKNADVRLAARRLLWGKIVNAGQVCVSQNYIMVDKEVVPGFIAELKTAMAEFFPNGVKASPDYGRIVNPAAFRRIKAMIDNSKGKILLGGTMDEKENFIEPTVVQVDSTDDSLIVDESFGPLIPILPVSNLDEAIRIANEVHSTPLGIYPFGSKKETDRGMQPLSHSDLPLYDQPNPNPTQSSTKPAPAAPPSTTPSSMPPSPPWHSVEPATPAKAPTAAAPPSTASFIAVP
jgi:beta-apo-4'-carotenal oxygenase